MKSEVLEPEVSLIADAAIKDWTVATLEKAPKYFYTGAASSTGKYHPNCTLKVGGLIVHVKRVVYLANRLCSGFGITGIDRDIVLSGAILHDIAKTGKGGPGSYQDYQNHPLNTEQYHALFADKALQPSVNKIKGCIRNHMGLWTPDGAKKPLSEYTPLELVVYLSDYLATTKDLVTPVDRETV